MNEYENFRRIVYGENECGATFIPVHEGCGLFVKADKTIKINMEGEWIEKPNAFCKKHGRVKMIFEGYY